MEAIGIAGVASMYLTTTVCALRETMGNFIPRDWLPFAPTEVVAELGFLPVESAEEE